MRVRSRHFNFFHLFKISRRFSSYLLVSIELADKILNISFRKRKKIHRDLNATARKRIDAILETFLRKNRSIVLV